MTDEAAFWKFLGSSAGIKATVQLRNCEITESDFAQVIWQAAISYMKEQSKEVVEAIRERDRLGFAVVNVIGKLDEIIENTQEIEIDDFLHISVPIDMWNELESSLEDMPNRADLYTTPQRQQPLKRLSNDDIEFVVNGWTTGDYLELANAIMDEMQEINK